MMKGLLRDGRDEVLGPDAGDGGAEVQRQMCIAPDMKPYCVA